MDCLERADASLSAALDRINSSAVSGRPVYLGFESSQLVTSFVFDTGLASSSTTISGAPPWLHSEGIAATDASILP